MALAVGSLAALPLPANAALDVSGYHRFTEVERQLQDLSRGRRDVTLQVLGRSAGGRPIYVVRVASPGGVDPDARPAVFVGANIAGYHNAGTEAALHLLAALTAAGRGERIDKLLAEQTFYVAPALNPDAHDALFATPRVRRGGNASTLDRDVDGLVGEDPADDLNGDGAITWMRIPDLTGGFLPSPADARILVPADPKEGLAGTYRREIEGKDDDGDGRFNEDGKDGVWPDKNFPHAFPHDDREAGPWSSYAPETKALLDYLLGRRNVAAVVVFGPANNLLAAPQSLGGSAKAATTFRVPEFAAKSMGLDPEKDYTLDEIWEIAKDISFVRQNDITKEQLAQFLGGGPATKVESDDQAVFDKLAEAYKERLKGAGLSADRPGAQYGKGGLTPWAYYQLGALALELDVWGIPKAAKSDDKSAEEALTLDKVAALSTEEFLALGEERIGAFLTENKVPPQFDAKAVMGMMRGGQATPKAMVERMRSMGGGDEGGDDAKAGAKGAEREREILAWLEANAPGGIVPWTPVTLPDGTKAEVGGLDPFATVAPPHEILAPALAVHTETVLDLAGRLPHLSILSLEARPLGTGVYLVRAVAANRSELPTHTRMAARARSYLPVRLELATGKDVRVVTGLPWVTSERLDGKTGVLEGEWLVQAEPGTEIRVTVTSNQAGRAEKTLTLPKGGAR